MKMELNVSSGLPISSQPKDQAQIGLKVPQKKFTDVRRRPVASIKQPKDVDNRRDIDILFQDMDIQDLSNVAEKGDINKIIEIKMNKFEQNLQSSSFKNKRPKTSEGESALEIRDPRENKEEFEQDVMLQALAFQRELQEIRRLRVTFAKQGLKKAMERQAIGSSGYGRFLCSHYTPGPTFIPSLNSIAQKLETKIKEKKRKTKENRKQEENKETEEKEQSKAEPAKSKEEEKRDESSKNDPSPGNLKCYRIDAVKPKSEKEAEMNKLNKEEEKGKNKQG